MKKLLLKLLFRKQYEYNFYFKDGDKKKYFNIYSPYELDKHDLMEFAVTIDSITDTKVEPYTEETMNKIKYIVNYKKPISSDVKEKIKSEVSSKFPGITKKSDEFSLEGLISELEKETK